MEPPIKDEERQARSIALEQAYVHDAYFHIAPHFVEKKYRAWPRVKQFIQGLEPGSLLADVGCGPGRYMGLGGSDLYQLGLDTCLPLLEAAHKRGNHQVALGDNLKLPFRDESFDAALSVAVIHHFATRERRVQAIQELARILRIGGKVMITAWAMEQRHRKFESQDVLVPWNQPNKSSSEDPGSSAECEVTSTTTSDDDVLIYQAYNNRTGPDTEWSPAMHRRSRFRDAKRFSRGRSMDCQRSPSSSSDLSSPNETCYSFVRRALKKLSTSPYNYGSSRPYFYSSCRKPWLYDSTERDGYFQRNHAEDEEDQTWDNEHLPIELRHLDEPTSESHEENNKKNRSLSDLFAILPNFLRSRSKEEKKAALVEIHKRISTASDPREYVLRSLGLKNGIVRSKSTVSCMSRFVELKLPEEEAENIGNKVCRKDLKLDISEKLEEIAQKKESGTESDDRSTIMSNGIDVSSTVMEEDSMATYYSMPELHQLDDGTHSEKDLSEPDEKCAKDVFQSGQSFMRPAVSLPYLHREDGTVKRSISVDNPTAERMTGLLRNRKDEEDGSTGQRPRRYSASAAQGPMARRTPRSALNSDTSVEDSSEDSFVSVVPRSSIQSDTSVDSEESIVSVIQRSPSDIDFRDCFMRKESFCHLAHPDEPERSKRRPPLSPAQRSTDLKGQTTCALPFHAEHFFPSASQQLQDVPTHAHGQEVATDLKMTGDRPFLESSELVKSSDESNTNSDIIDPKESTSENSVTDTQVPNTFENKSAKCEVFIGFNRSCQSPVTVLDNTIFLNKQEKGNNLNEKQIQNKQISASPTNVTKEMDEKNINEFVSTRDIFTFANVKLDNKADVLSATQDSVKVPFQNFNLSGSLNAKNQKLARSSTNEANEIVSEYSCPHNENKHIFKDKCLLKRNRSDDKEHVTHRTMREDRQFHDSLKTDRATVSRTIFERDGLCLLKKNSDQGERVQPAVVGNSRTESKIADTDVEQEERESSHSAQVLPDLASKDSRDTFSINEFTKSLLDRLCLLQPDDNHDENVMRDGTEKHENDWSNQSNQGSTELPNTVDNGKPILKRAHERPSVLFGISDSLVKLANEDGREVEITSPTKSVNLLLETNNQTEFAQKETEKNEDIWIPVEDVELRPGQRPDDRNNNSFVKDEVDENEQLEKVMSNDRAGYFKREENKTCNLEPQRSCDLEKLTTADGTVNFQKEEERELSELEPESSYSPGKVTRSDEDDFQDKECKTSVLMKYDWLYDLEKGTINDVSGEIAEVQDKQEPEHLFELDNERRNKVPGEFRSEQSDKPEMQNKCSDNDEPDVFEAEEQNSCEIERELPLELEKVSRVNVFEDEERDKSRIYPKRLYEMENVNSDVHPSEFQNEDPSRFVVELQTGYGLEIVKSNDVQCELEDEVPNRPGLGETKLLFEFEKIKRNDEPVEIQNDPNTTSGLEEKDITSNETEDPFQFQHFDIPRLEPNTPEELKFNRLLDDPNASGEDKSEVTEKYELVSDDLKKSGLSSSDDNISVHQVETHRRYGPEPKPLGKILEGEAISQVDSEPGSSTESKGRIYRRGSSLEEYMKDKPFHREVKRERTCSEGTLMIREKTRGGRTRSDGTVPDGVPLKDFFDCVVVSGVDPEDPEEDDAFTADASEEKSDEPETESSLTEDREEHRPIRAPLLGEQNPSLSLSTSQESLQGPDVGGSVTLHRYYHVFREGELDHLIDTYVENLHIISSYYDHANWCVIAEKVQVWTI